MEQDAYALRLMAADAPAAAKSCLPLAVRPAARGKLLMLLIDPPALVRLLILAAVAAVAPEILREAPETALWGLMPVRTALLLALFGAAVGGSGSGRGAENRFTRFDGDESLADNLGMATGAFWPVMNSWRTASSGRRRLSGSQRRQRLIKSRKPSSSHFNTCCSVLDEGRRLRPLEDTVNLGLPMESKKSFFLVLFSIKCFSGGPNTSMMHASCSCSFSPGKMGTPVYSSAKMQPTLHMSMGMPYVMPRITSGDR